MNQEVIQMAQLLCEDAQLIQALMNHSEQTVSANLSRGKSTLHSIIDTANKLLNELEKITPYPYS